MSVKKRSLPMYIFLNCITLGIYGFVVSSQIGKEINYLCKGDGERPAVGYFGAVMYRAIAVFIGLIFGLIMGVLQVNEIGISFGWMSLDGGWSSSCANTLIIFGNMIFWGTFCTAFGGLLSGIYFKYWWYTQTNRLKLNAWRYGLTVRESGMDNFLFRTVCEILFVPVTLVLYGLSFAFPSLIIWLVSLANSEGALIFAAILLFLCTIPMLLFGMELTTGANFAMYFTFKTLNRFADACHNSPEPFDRMGYKYYPSCENKYPNFLPGLINEAPPEPSPFPAPAPRPSEGSITGIKGTCAGYRFDLTAGEEIVIGKDAKLSQIVIETAYKEISRKHVGVCYNMEYDQYLVTDYSTNGTWADGSRMAPGQGTYMRHGTELALANRKNIFRLD